MQSAGKHLLLINPWIYDFTAYDLWSKPLGLLYLASFLRKYGFEVSYIDCLEQKVSTGKYGTGNFERQIVDKPSVLGHIPRHFARYGISEEAFRNKVAQAQKPDAILITSIMTYWYPGPRRAVEIIREIYPGKPIILGGIYATLLPDHARANVKPDHIITGPGESKVLQLLCDLFSLDFSSYMLPHSLDDYPYPAFDLVADAGYLTIMSARGCPYECSFCAQKKISMPFTQRNPELVVREITDHYSKYRIRDFAFYDDALFLGRDKHIKVILRGLIDKRLPLRLHSPNGLFARFIDPELAELMFRSNFKTIRLSFETSNEKRRGDMYNKISNDGMKEAVKNLVNAGFKPSDLDAYVIMGLPHQELAEILESVIFVNDLGVQTRLASFSPIPGTLDFDRAVKAGMIRSDIDPLLTNKSIFPLADENINYETFRKVRIFSQMLNDAARRGFKPFSDSQIGPAIKEIMQGKK